MAANGPHSNPVWSTFVFVICMLLFLFYLESMVNPMDFHVSKSFVVHEYHNRNWQQVLPVNQSKFVTYDDIINGSFDINGIGNTLVSLSIPKTGGSSLSKHVALDIHPDSGLACNCTMPEVDGTNNLPPSSCVCDHKDTGVVSPWFFNQMTVGWPCGIHAGWTDLTLACLDNELNRHNLGRIGRRYATITMLSNPLIRYFHEWQHVRMHGQWPVDNIHCHPLQDTHYFNGNWTNVMLDAFLRCPDNPSNNRQVRMLADLRSTECSDVIDSITHSHHYVTTEPDHVRNVSNALLDSAKENLRRIPFFGLLEYLPETEQLFEYTFGIRFLKLFVNIEVELPVKLTAHQRETIEELTSFDIQLYDFAKNLFHERLSNMSKLYSTLKRENFHL